MAGLWRNNEETKEGKYLVKRRDGTVPEWPNFVLGAKDAAAPRALRAYAETAASLGYDPDYVTDIFNLACEFEEYYGEHGPSDPDAPPHRKDDLATIREMQGSSSESGAGEMEETL